MSNTPNTLSPELKAKIEKEALKIYPFSGRVIGGMDIDFNHDKRVEWIKGAEVYALKLQQAEDMMEKMAAALIKIIEMNRQHAEDQYGDPDKAETWGCVRVAREPLSEYNNYKQTKDGTVNG